MTQQLMLIDVYYSFTNLPMIGLLTCHGPFVDA